LQEQKGLLSNPWDQLPRRQQQVLVRLLARVKSDKSAELIVKPMDVESWFSVSDRTAREWLSDWVKVDFVKPISTGAGDRIHKYELIDSWCKVLEQAS
jgi:hypothetical protein